ncbi:MAG: hypothetical protein JWR69_3408 [Pedosphaera sp.]|nr:hypothetical protein [Pedosphaera sp.]
MNHKTFASIGAAVLGCFILASPALAQNTAFTYQGRLMDGGAPASGSYDFAFTLFDDVSVGNQVSNIITNASTAVSNGLFTLTLDFGAGIFTGPARWLEIGVRTNGGASFTSLSLRQPLTPAPYAIYAANAGIADTATTASDVAGGAVVSSVNSLKDAVILQAGSNVTITPAGNTLTIASAGAGGSGIWNLSGTNAYFTTGKVGIGTNAPSHRLSIANGPFWTANLWRGAIDLENASAIGWQSNAGGQRFGIGQSSGGLYFFRTTSNPGTTATAANYDMELTDSGNLMIAGGAERVGVKLQVNGAAAFASGGSGGEVQFGAPNGETGMTIIGGARADIRFDGSALKLLAGPVGGPPSPANGGVSISTSGKVGVGTASPAGALHVASGGLAVTGGSSPYSGAGAGVFLESGGNGGSLFAFNYSTFAPRNLLLNSPGGNVGIGTTTPTTKLYVDGSGGGYTTAAVHAVNTPGIAGEFVGRVTVSESLVVALNVGAGSASISGNLTKGSGSFKIDHPLDPANKFLYHSFVESPDMMNIYNGNIALDAIGEAVVELPEWFESLNKDFRYQLTAIGAPGPNLYIAEEIAGNHFKIAGGQPGTKVSWQVTGVRQDAFANAHRIRVEEDKTGSERGSYLHPELFGAPNEKRIMH